VNILQMYEKIKVLAARTDGVFRTADLKAQGLTAYNIQKLIENHTIERIKPGFYSLYSAQDSISEAEFISRLFPDGVLCMYTALFYYGYSDRTPLEWDLAFDKNTSKSRFKLEYPFIKPYYMKPELLTFGITTGSYGNSVMKIFDRERLICETIFFEDKIDRETYNKAIQGYVSDAKKIIPNLLEYAKKRRIIKKVKDRIGVWL
jgi:predicted transcriptional regulator of viral defense system